MDAELTAMERRALRRKIRLAVLESLHELGGQATRSEVHAAALIRADFTRRERQAPRPAHWTSKHPTQLEAQLSFAFGDLRRAGLLVRPSRGVWALAGVDTTTSEPLAAPTLGSRLEQLRSMPYDEYLRTPEWHETRATAVHRYGNACALDAKHTDRLQGHHRDYTRRGEERLQDVIVLCHECHTVFHHHFGRPGPRVEPAPSVPPPFVADVQPEPKPAPRSLLQRLAARLA